MAPEDKRAELYLEMSRLEAAEAEADAAFLHAQARTYECRAELFRVEAELSYASARAVRQEQEPEVIENAR